MKDFKMGGEFRRLSRGKDQRGGGRTFSESFRSIKQCCLHEKEAEKSNEDS